jgi:hypothetical protein
MQVMTISIKYQAEKYLLGEGLHDRHVSLASPLERLTDIVEVVHRKSSMSLLRVRRWYGKEPAA